MSGVHIVSCSVMDFDFSGLLEVLVPRVFAFFFCIKVVLDVS